MASEPLPEMDAIDPLDEREEGGLAWGVSEVAYRQMQSVAVDHALLPRTAALPAPQPWICAGPRNLGGRITALAQDPTNALRLWAGSGHGGLWRTTDGGDTWDHVGGQRFNDPVGALAIHPDRPNSIWVGTGSLRSYTVSGSGLYRITVVNDVPGPPRRLAPAPPAFDTPASMTAQPETRGAALRYTAIELDPDNPDVAFVASQTGLWHCIDMAGAPVWRRLLPAEPDALAPDDGDPDGLPPLANAPLASLNDSWPSYVTDLRVARDPRDREKIAIGERKVARYLVVFAAVTSDGGGVGGVYRGRFDRATRHIKWDAQKANIPFPLGYPGQYLRARLALCRSQPKYVYAVFEGKKPNPRPTPSGPVFRSSDCGDTWIPGGIFAGDNNQANYTMVLEVHPDDPSILVGGTLDLAVSTDGGANFTQILDWKFYDRGDHAQHADQHALIFDIDDRRKIWSGNDGGLSMARDISVRGPRPGFWRKRSHGIMAGQFQDLSTFPTTAADAGDRLRFLTAGGLQDNGSWISYGGPTWYHIGWADGSGSAIHAADPRAVFSAQNNGCNYPTIAAGLAPGLERVIKSPVIADISSVQPMMEVAHPWFPLPAGPFVGFIDQDPRPVPEPPPPLLPVRARQVIYSGTASAVGRPVAHLLTVPAASPAPATFRMSAAFVTAIGPPPAAVAAQESATAVAFGPPPPAAPLGPPPPPPGPTVDGWIGTSQGQLFHTTAAPLGTAAAPWAAVASFPPAPMRPHQPDRILAHPVAANLVAIAASPTGAAAMPAAIQPIQVRVSGAGGAIGTVSVDYASGAAVSPAAVTTPIMELGDSGLVVRFTVAALAAGDIWTIGTDNRVTKNGAASNEIEVIARLYGRVLLSYDRGVTWTDLSWARARPAAPAAADTDSLPFCPVTSLRWDIVPGPPGQLRLFVGTLAGVYVLENLPGPAAAAPALAGFNPVWRPFFGKAPGLLPLTLVNDIEMIAGSRILRIATFGRGIWDCNLDGGPRRRLFIRQTVVESGRLDPRALPPTLPDDPRLPAGRLFMDHAHAFDIRVDTAPFEFLDDVADGVEFDERIGVDDIRPLERQAVYVQVHNSGWDEVHDVTVHLLWASAPAAPLGTGGAPPPLVPAGLPNAATFYVPPDFNPANAWQRVGPPRRIAQVRPGEPKVVRFDWLPPDTLDVANSHVALLALCASPEDPLPAALPGGVVTMADFLASERRAALRIVPVRVSPAVDLFIRDGVDDDARAGNVAFIGRSPDIIVVQAAPADPAAAFAQLIDARPGDVIKGGVANHIYVRIHNRGLSNAIAEVRVWATPLDANQQPNFAFASWIPLTAAPPATGEVAVVTANSTELVPVVWNNPPDPNPADAAKAYGLIVTLGAIGTADPPPHVPALTSAGEFWAYFGERFGSDNAALRVLRWEP